mmetsp:Transcript_126193/g.353388  ORF Transcript_126193/g.353388 Transcript_126193/m.353388 type:complete len:194 (+) Transcript_126193:101-682(+)
MGNCANCESVAAQNAEDPVAVPVGSMEECEGPLRVHPACQAAFDGDVGRLKELLDVSSEEMQGMTGYVRVNGEICGLWTMVFNTFQLKAVKDDSTLRAATPLHWAAFAGRADVVRFLVTERGVPKDVDGGFGFSPFAMAASHRLDVDGGVVEGEGAEVQRLLEEEEPPLCPTMLARAASRRQMTGDAEPEPAA